MPPSRAVPPPLITTPHGGNGNGSNDGMIVAVCLDEKEEYMDKTSTGKLLTMTRTFDPNTCKLLVTNRVGSKEYMEAANASIPIVSTAFLDKCAEMAEEVVDWRPFCLKPFTGLCITVSGYAANGENGNTGKRSELIQMIQDNGGTYSGALASGISTHLVTERPEGQKYLAAKSWNTVKIVTAEWVSTCMESGMYQDETPFLVQEDGHHPTSMKRKKGTSQSNIPTNVAASTAAATTATTAKKLHVDMQPALLPPSLMTTTTTTPATTTAPLPIIPPTTECEKKESSTPIPDNEMQALNRCLNMEISPHRALTGCIVYIECNGNTDRWKALRRLCVHCDATVVWEWHSDVTHTVIAAINNNATTINTLRRTYPGSFLVTPQWLITCAMECRRAPASEFTWSPPPPPIQPTKMNGSGNNNASTAIAPATTSSSSRPSSRLATVRGMLICVSQYTGAERVEVETLCKKLGATYTDVLTRTDPQVNILVCKEFKGDKYKAAIKWGIRIQTLEWLRALLMTDV